MPSQNTIYEPKDITIKPLNEAVEEVFMLELAPKIKRMISEIIEKAKEELFDPLQIVKKLESLKDDERLDASAVKNLTSLIQVYGGKNLGGGGGDTIRYTDLSSQLNGSTKTFTISRANRVLGVFGTQFPVNARPEVDWTFSQATRILTLTDAVSAPATGQTLWVMYVEGS